MNTDSTAFRPIIGFIAVVGSLASFGALFMLEIPARNENALMFAMGIVFQWGSSVFASEYGSSNIGRKVAEGAMKRMDRSLPTPAPHDAIEAAEQVATAAEDKRDEIKGEKP